MRNIINISLPASMTKSVEKEVREGGFATKSEFFRHLLRVWNTYKLAGELEESRKEFETGKGKVLRSLRDLR